MTDTPRTVEIDSRDLLPPQEGERVLSADDMTALTWPRVDLGAFLRMTFAQKELHQQDIFKELIEDGVITLRKGPKGGFVVVVGPVKPTPNPEA